MPLDVTFCGATRTVMGSRGLIDVLLTHAHIDHSGAPPLLMKAGFKGPIWTMAVPAEVAQIEGQSANADRSGRLSWLQGLGQAPSQVFVTHGEPHAADTLRLRIQEQLGWRARVPDCRETFRLA